MPRTAPLLGRGLLSFTPSMGYGDVGGFAASGACVRRGMALLAWLGSGATQAGEGPSVRLEGAASIGVKIEVAADADSVVRR